MLITWWWLLQHEEAKEVERAKWNGHGDDVSLFLWLCYFAFGHCQKSLTLVRVFWQIFPWLSVMCDVSTKKEGTNPNLLPEPQSPDLSSIMCVMYLSSMFWGKNNLHNNGGEWLLWANGDGQGMWTQAGGLEVTWSSIIRSEEERKMVSKGWYQIIVWYVGTLCRDRIDNFS